MTVSPPFALQQFFGQQTRVLQNALGPHKMGDLEKGERVSNELDELPSASGDSSVAAASASLLPGASVGGVEKAAAPATVSKPDSMSNQVHPAFYVM